MSKNNADQISKSEIKNILKVLNTVKSADQLAEIIEIPETPDVGTKIAQLILDYRQEKGLFSNLMQLREVPNVGPKRFNCIIESLRGYTFPYGLDVEEVQSIGYNSSVKAQILNYEIPSPSSYEGRNYVEVGLNPEKFPFHKTRAFQEVNIIEYIESNRNLILDYLKNASKEDLESVLYLDFGLADLYVERVTNQYPATFSFEDELIGTIPQGWELKTWGTNASGEAMVVSLYKGHEQVVKIRNLAGGVTATFIQHTFEEPKEQGTVEWWALTDAGVNNVCYFQKESIICGLNTTGNVIYFSGHTRNTYTPLNTGVGLWHHFKVIFNCNGGQNSVYDLYVDNKQVATGISFYNNQQSVTGIKFQTEAGNGKYVYFDSVGFSWDPSYNVGENKLEREREAVRSKPVNANILERINTITEDNKEEHLGIKYNVFLDLVEIATNQGKIPAFSMTLGGKSKLRWARAKNYIPRIFFIETYRLTNFPGDYGPGRLVKTFSLLPGEETEIAIKTWKKSSTSIKEASSILDSYTEEKADEFEQNLQREFSNTVVQEESDTFNVNASVKATYGAGVDSTKNGKGVKAGGSVSAEASVGYEKTRRACQETMVKALSNTTTKHAQKSSAKREVNIETNYERMEDEGEEVAITRKVENLNVSRTLNFTFRQMNQEFHSLIHLVDLTIGFFNGYPGSMKEYELSEIGDLVREFVIDPEEFPIDLPEGASEDELTYTDAQNVYDTALNYLKDLILEEYGNKKIIDYHGEVRTFVKVEQESILLPPASAKEEPIQRNFEYLRVLNASDKDGFSDYEIRKGPQEFRTVPGIIVGTNVVSMRTDGVVVEALIGRENALDDYALDARKEKIREDQYKNDFKKVEIEKIRIGIGIIKSLIESGNQEEAVEAYKEIFGVKESLKAISEALGPQVLDLERKLMNK